MNTVVAVTPGEPAGIGPELLLKQAMLGFDSPVIAIASKHLLQERADSLGLAVNIVAVEVAEFNQLTTQANTPHVLDVPLVEAAVAGTLNPNNAAYVINTLDKALELALANKIAALVTGPVHKGIINDAGLPFTGHTEYLRDNSQTKEVVMMLATEGLRVALVTTHLPLKDVSAAITKEKIKSISRILHQSLSTQFGCTQPKILIAGLNPHAGEDGHLGREEIDTIIPAIKELSDEGITLTGPLPADTLFQPHYLDTTDAVLAMYHDQGLPVLKYKGFGNAVNITLGLPYIRTSVDHGTALDLAGTGKANLGSLQVALKTACEMAEQQEKYNA